MENRATSETKSFVIVGGIPIGTGYFVMNHDTIALPER